MGWNTDALMAAMMEDPTPPVAAPSKVRTFLGLRLVEGRALAWKSALLLVTTLAFVPVLVWQHDMAAAAYIVALVFVHVIGLIVLIAKSGHWWKDKRTLAWRLLAITILAGFLSLIGKGLTGATGAVFWATLAGVWLLHTAGAVMFHLRGESRVCPFVPTPGES